MGQTLGGRADPHDAPLRELFFPDMLERGFYLARRGMLALSLEVGDAETARFTDVIAEFATHRALLAA